MKNKGIVLIILLLTILAWPSKGFSLQEETHQAINKNISKKTINSFSLNEYLRNNLNFNAGSDEFLKGVDADGKTVNNQVFWWLGYGGVQEDRPGDWYDYLPIIGKPTRSVNHFHNPLKHWSEAGLNDKILGILSYTGQSQVLWAQNSNQNVGGRWSWLDARRYFYIALTGRNFDGSEAAKTKADRDAYYAYTFRAIGQLMHLVQDTSVPEHTRNDAHVLPAYEMYVENIRNSVVWTQWMSNPNPPFDPAIFNVPTVPLAPIPISRIIDTDFYNGQNPEITTNSRIGIAEYTNTNFLSGDTMFTDDLDYSHRHYAPYPKGSNAILWTESFNNRRYLRKVGDGESIAHLAVASILYNDRLKYFPQYNHALPVGLDDKCYEEYSSKLIPRAVGYSAGLLNYFFRGDLKLEYETGAQPGYVVVNNSNERMEGVFELYYDDRNDVRRFLADDSSFSLNPLSRHEPFDLIPPEDAKEPDKYILVFKGKLGNEEGAVAGYVFQRILEITPPAEYLYSIINGNQSPQQFTSVKALVRNTNANEQIQNGVIQAIAKYRMDVDQIDFVYSVSAPISISSLSSTTPQGFTFDFSSNPIPVDITDLYLQVVFNGRIGSEDNAVAMGIKDISEPTPIDLFNDTDRACLYLSWYDAGSPEAIDLVDTNDNGIPWWDIYPHKLEDIYIKFSSASNPQNASPDNYDHYISRLEAGTFIRAAYILTEHEFRYSIKTTWLKTDPRDTFMDTETTGLYAGTAVKNQTEFTYDTETCEGDAPCYITYESSYHTYKDVSMWWGAGIVYINTPYPEDQYCEKYRWD